jgi:hypothetical protein
MDTVRIQVNRLGWISAAEQRRRVQKQATVKRSTVLVSTLRFGPIARVPIDEPALMLPGTLL